MAILFPLRTLFGMVRYSLRTWFTAVVIARTHKAHQLCAEQSDEWIYRIAIPIASLFVLCLPACPLIPNLPMEWVN
ncbi:MAG: hypothetical protein F6K11_06800 [Leptolyngbya sp. SIO3F4]|nr:hypothetical protein [Leptolyngbya sp. SIO3F4]